MSQLFEYNMFVDKDYRSRALPSEGYKMIKVHLVIDVKHDGGHKARLVVDGHLTKVSVDSVYSGVVSLCELHSMMFLGELNILEIWATKIGRLEGQSIVICKALYRLRTSGLRCMKGLLIVYGKKALNYTKLNTTFGCGPMLQSMNTLLYMLTIYLLQ